MNRTIVRTGLMASLALAICGSVPAKAQDDAMVRHHMMHRAMRHEMHREMRHHMMHRMMRHEMHREMHHDM